MVGKLNWNNRDTDTNVAVGKAEVQWGRQVSQTDVGWRWPCTLLLHSGQESARPGSNWDESCRCLRCSLIFDSPSFPGKVDSLWAHTPGAPPHQISSWRRFQAQSITVFKKHDGALLVWMFVFMTFSLLAYKCAGRRRWDSSPWRGYWNRSAQRE